MTAIPTTPAPGLVALDEGVDVSTGPTNLPLVAVVLGIAGVALGASVVWYLPAIVVGGAAVAVGFLAFRRHQLSGRARSNATVGAVLGVIAIVLGISAAVFLPRMVQRVDDFFGTLQGDVNHNVTKVTDSVQRDVDRIDRTVSRDLRRLEASNRRDVDSLNRQSSETFDRLEAQMRDVETRLTNAEQKDLGRLEASLRDDLRNLEAEVHRVEQDLARFKGDIEVRVKKLEDASGP